MIEIQNLTVKYPMGSTALSDLSFKIPSNGIFCIFGTAESGKTTLLNAICGLAKINQGSIYINNVKVDELTPINQSICLALENGGFFENKSVIYNLEYPLKIRNLKSEIIKQTIDKIAEKFSLSNILQMKIKKTDELTRVKIKFAKFFLRESSIYLIDNPFKKIPDRKNTFENFLQYIYELSETSIVVYATDSPDEAIKLNTHTLMLNYGIMQQCDRIEEIIANPNSLFIIKNFIKNSVTYDGCIKKIEDEVVLYYNKISKTLDTRFLINDIYIGENVLVCEYFDNDIMQIKIFDLNSEKLIYFKHID